MEHIQKLEKRFTLFGEGYWEDSGSYNDVTQLLSDWSRAGEMPAKGVLVWTLCLQWGVDCMCATDDWVGVGGNSCVTTPDVERR